MEARSTGRYSPRMTRVKRLFLAICAASSLAAQSAAALEATETQPPPPSTSSQLVHIGTGDQIRIDVFGNTDLTTTTTVAADGTIRLPLVGAVKVGGASPTEAADAIETAFRDGDYLVNPHITLTVVQSSSQRVSVLGEVRGPGRYPVESTTTVLDLIALAGGITEKGSDIVQILRPTESGTKQISVDIRSFMSARDANAPPFEAPRGGDTILVPKATFFINGQVAQAGEYRIEGDMVLYQAIARAGGVTPLGSASRVEIRRRTPDGKFVDIKGKKNMRIEPGDVIKIKERLF
jgi:polysaccharide biosynthesis/export protein